MTIILDYTCYEEYLVERRYPVWIDKYPESAVVQYLFKFENDYGASVYKNEETIGGHKDLWEFCAVQWVGENMYATLDYCDGNMTDEDICKRLEFIKNLPPRVGLEEPKID